jgi:hypothetical protein
MAKVGVKLDPWRVLRFKLAVEFHHPLHESIDIEQKPAVSTQVKLEYWVAKVLGERAIEVLKREGWKPPKK